jgi:uncharacterized protein
MARPDFLTRYGPWALVAGASEGIGAEFATQLAARGLHLVLVARRQQGLDEVSAQLTSAYHIEIRTVALDLAREDAATVLVESTRDIEIGLLVYNAAVSLIGTYLEISLDDHLREIAVNCRTSSTLTYLFAQQMVQRRHGGIILMSSMSGSQGSALVTHYGATKAYNRVLAEGLWDELRSQGVDVMASCPAPVNTPGYVASAPRGRIRAIAPSIVVKEALDTLGKGPINIPGASWRLASFFMQHFIPNTTAIKLMGNATRGMYEKRD